MSRIPAESLEAPPRTAPASAPPLARLEPGMARHLADACRLVAADPAIATTVTLVADLTTDDEDAAWVACDRRVAELVQEYGVEVWLAQEARQVRIRIEQYHPALPPLPAPPTEQAEPEEPDEAPAAAPQRGTGLGRWWRGRGGRR